MKTRDKKKEKEKKDERTQLNARGSEKVAEDTTENKSTRRSKWKKKTFVAMDYSNKCQKLKIEKWVNRQIWKCIYTITALKQEKLKTKRKNEAFHKKLE